MKKFKNTFENILENGAFAQKEEMLHFLPHFQINDILKVSKRIILVVV